LIRKRKQPSISTSQPSKGKTTTVPEVTENEVAQAKKQKKVEEPKPQQAPTKDQGGERKAKKKHEEKKATLAVKVKSTAKKPKVHRVLKILTSSESGGNPSPQKDAGKENVVDQDHPTNTEEERVDKPQGNPIPHSETLVNDEQVTDGNNEGNAQPGNDAPNAEKGSNTNIGPEVEGKEVKLA
jgi:hypothetical protein